MKPPVAKNNTAGLASILIRREETVEKREAAAVGASTGIIIIDFEKRSSETAITNLIVKLVDTFNHFLK